MENQEINDGHYLELLDRIFISASTLETYCLSHPVAKEDKSISDNIEEALAALAEAYQQVGAKLQKQ